MNIDKKIEKIISPPRTNFSNLQINLKNTLSNFIKSQRTLKTPDDKTFTIINYKNKNSLTKNPFPTIIYNHSYGSNKNEGLYILNDCLKYNLDLCIYDSRASGDNSGEFITFGFLEKIDLLFIILKLNFEFNCEEFILWGRSIGCNAILQFYQTMISNESTFLNNLKKKKRKEENFFMSNRAIVTNDDLPNDFNKFVSDYLQSYLLKNESLSQDDFFYNFKFTISGIILDSPYTSFSEFVKDNLKKFIPFLSKFLSTPLIYYLKNYFLKKIKVDVSKKQNIDIISVVNLNTVFIISDKDELISKDRFINLVKNFASKFLKKNKPQIFKTNQKHRSKRSKDLSDKSVFHILNNKRKNNIFTFCHKQKNPFFTKKTNVKGIQSIKKWNPFLSKIKNDNILNEYSFEEVSTNHSDSDIKKNPPQNLKEEKIIMQKLGKIDINNIINDLRPKNNDFEKVDKKNKNESSKLITNKKINNNLIFESPENLKNRIKFEDKKKRASTQRINRKNIKSNRFFTNNNLNQIKFSKNKESEFIKTKGSFTRFYDNKFKKKVNPLQFSIIKK